MFRESRILYNVMKKISYVMMIVIHSGARKRVLTTWGENIFACVLQNSDTDEK